MNQSLENTGDGRADLPRRVSLLFERKERRNKRSEEIDLLLQSRLDHFFSAVRNRFGFKRKEMEVSVETGLATLRTPHFELSIEPVADSGDPSEVEWRHRVSLMGDLSLVESEPFQMVFGAEFDTLLIDLAHKLEVSDLIDRLEEKELPGVSLDYDSRSLWCEIQIKGFTDIIRVESQNIRITRLSIAHLSELTLLVQKLGLPM